MPHKTHHIQSMYYQSNQWMLSNVSVWWQNVVTMMYSWQWGIASYHLAVRYCSLQGLLGQKTEGIILPGMAHSTPSCSHWTVCWAEVCLVQHPALGHHHLPPVFHGAVWKPPRVHGVPSQELVQAGQDYALCRHPIQSQSEQWRRAWAAHEPGER